MSIISPELLKLHLVSEGEKLHNEIMNGVSNKFYLIRVGVRIYRYESVNDFGKKQLIYQRENFIIHRFIRWKWYFRYLAAKEQVKTPKQLVQINYYSYIAPNEDEVLLKVLNNKLIAAKREHTKMKLQIEKFKGNCSILFIEDDPNYQKALKKIKEKNDLINELSTEIKNLNLKSK